MSLYRYWTFATFFHRSMIVIKRSISCEGMYVEVGLILETQKERCISSTRWKVSRARSRDIRSVANRA